MKQRYKAWIACFLVCLMTVGVLPIQAFAKNTISITSLEDWNQFVTECKLDRWSVGKEVVLQTDLDLSGVFRPIPIFSGSFDGNGHTITIGKYSKAGSDMGLFRYLNTGAVIKNLTVFGTWEPSGQKSQIGGIVGHNSGAIENCVFQGAVDGKNNIGGIVGVNEVTGSIKNCKTRGTVQGEHYTGGIAGQNLGGIFGCSNESKVNTENGDITPKFGDFEITDINNTENLSVYTDTGGIAGFSSGVLQGCENNGEIGYQHVGYNVGGIAGRQSGYVYECSNKGKIYGRKDVGGIVGQLEPYVILQFSKDHLNRLSDAFSGLQDIMDGMIEHTQGSLDDFNIRMDSISALSDMARDSADYLVDRTENYVDQTIDATNEFSRRADRFLSETEKMVGMGLDVGDDLGKALDQLALSMEQLDDSTHGAKAALNSLEYGITQASSGVSGYMSAINNVSASVKNVIKVQMMVQSGQATLEDLLQAIESLKRSFERLKKSGGDLKDSVDEMEQSVSNATESGKKTVDGLQESLDTLQRSIQTMQDVQDGLSDILTEMDWAVTLLRQEGALQLPVPDAEYKEQVDTLMNRTGDILDEFGVLRKELTVDGETLIQDMQAMNDQLRVIMQIMTDIYDDLLEDKTKDDVYEDVTEAYSNTTQGAVRSCVNYGKIEGDVGLGGICGAMAIEYDFDPEDDLVEQGDDSFRRKYKTKSILHDCTNYGSIEGRKEAIGGVVGSMKLGSVHDCTAYGQILSEEGDYIGGIAGESTSVIRRCAAKVTLSGDCYVGGIAGYGEDIFDCRAMVEMTDDPEAAGAIAGKADGTVAGNTFVEGTWGGIDDISLAGKAEPLPYETFLQQSDVPQRFHALYLTFLADNQVIKEIQYQYGERADSKEIPPVPPKDGTTGVWENLPEFVNFDRVLEPVYTQFSSSIASKELREDGISPVLLAEGAFANDASIQMRLLQEGDAGFYEEGDYLEGWQVELPEDGTKSHVLRYYPPETKGKVHLYLVQDGAATPIKAEKEGRYHCFAVEGKDVVFYAVAVPYGKMLIAAICILGGVGAILIFGNRKKIQSAMQKKKAEKQDKTKE